MSAAVPSLLFVVALGDGVITGVGLADFVALGDGLTVVAVTLPAFQSVATNNTIGETKELSSVSLVIPVWAARTFAASSCEVW